MVKKITTIKDFEGSVSVEGDITPITRQPISQVTPDRWGQMTASELHQQREILVNRYYAAIQAGLLDGAKTLQAGIMHLDSRLEDIGVDGPGFL